jgi:hypothetical protein
MVSLILESLRRMYAQSDWAGDLIEVFANGCPGQNVVGCQHGLDAIASFLSQTSVC